MRSVVVLMCSLNLLGCSEAGFSTVNNGLQVDGPALQVFPSLLDFGVFEVGDPVSVQTFTIKNVGNQTLDIEPMFVTGESPGSFTLLEPEQLPIEPDEARTVNVVYVPRDTEEQLAEVVVSSVVADPDVQPQQALVRFQGLGSVPLLQIEPLKQDFGTPRLDCPITETFTLTNVGNADLRVDALNLSNPAFTVIDGPTLPMTLAPAESSAFLVEFRPQTTGEASAVLTAYSNDPNGPREATPFGEGSTDGLHEDRWIGPESPPSDIVFLVDQSCSMDENTEKLNDNFDAFINELGRYSDNWQIMIVNDDDACSRTDILTPITPDFEEIFRDQSLKGGGRKTEELLSLADLALAKSIPGQCNEGFLRPLSLTHIIFVSDEPDNSDESWDLYYNRIEAQIPDDGELRISAIVGDVPDGCVLDGEVNEPGFGYVEASAAAGGLFLSICSDWASDANLARLAETSVVQDVYLLTHDALESTIVVTVNGVAVAEGWAYDIIRNAVIFVESPPTVGDEIVITYSGPNDCE
ncbi:MAG: choice-of-anchor D domain-containing protein [Myxococcota bacterium]